MAGNRGRGDPMAGLLSNLGGIDPNLFNKPTMGQLKSKQQPVAAQPKTTIPTSKADTIAAVGSPIRPDASASDSFSSRKSATTRAPEQAGLTSVSSCTFTCTACMSLPQLRLPTACHACSLVSRVVPLQFCMCCHSPLLQIHLQGPR